MKKIIFHLFCCLFLSTFAYNVSAQTIEPVTIPSASGYIRSIEFANENVGYAVASFGVVLKTEDAGKTWTALTEDTSVDDEYVTSVHILDANNIYLGQRGGSVKYSNDGGETWTTTASFTGNSLLDVCFTTKTDGYAVQDYGIVHRTVDGGLNWETMSLSTIDGVYSMLYPSAILFTDVNTGYIFGAGLTIGDGGAILKTTDAGDSWQVITPVNDSQSMNSASFPSANVGYGAGAYGKMIKTTDAGATWEILNTESNITFWDVEFVNNDEGFAAAKIYTVNNLLRTIDGGATWQTIDFGTFNVQSVGVVNKDLAYIGGYTESANGNVAAIMVYKSGEETGIINHAELNLSVYPNPATDILHVQGENIQKVAIYNSLGQMVKEGMADSQINVSALSGGIYYLVITTNDNRRAVEKIVIEK